MAIIDEPRTTTPRTGRAVRDARRAARATGALLRPRVLRAREGAPLAEGVAGGVPRGGDPGAGRLRRVRDLRRLDPGDPSARPVGQGVPQRVPSPRHAVVQGRRPSAGRADRVPVPRLALEPRRHQLLRVPARRVRPVVPGARRPAAARVPGRHVGRVRVDQHGSRRPPAARGVGAGVPVPRRGRRRGHARVVVEGDGRQRQLEAGAGGVPRGVPRDGDPPAAHVRRGREHATRRAGVHRVPERSRAVPERVDAAPTAASRRRAAPTCSSSSRVCSGRARTR